MKTKKKVRPPELPVSGDLSLARGYSLHTCPRFAIDGTVLIDDPQDIEEGTPLLVLARGPDWPDNQKDSDGNLEECNAMKGLSVLVLVSRADGPTVGWIDVHKGAEYIVFERVI